MKVHKTNKLFYRKYPYKIELSCKGAEFVKRFGHADTVDLCEGKTNSFSFKNRNFTDSQKQRLIEFSTVVTPVLAAGHKVRVEMNTMSFYLLDEATYDSLVKELELYIKSVTVPDSNEDLEKLYSKNHIVMCNKLPHKKYEYRLMLKENLSEKAKESLVIWIDNAGDEVSVPGKTNSWLRGNRTWIYDPFIYAKSSKNLTMLSLILGSSIKRIYEYVLRDTQINSVTEDSLCQT